MYVYETPPYLNAGTEFELSHDTNLREHIREYEKNNTKMSKVANQDWADDFEGDDAGVSNELPPQTVSTNKDGTKTFVSWRLNDDGKKVKTTRRIRYSVIKEKVNPRVAERKAWPKFGLSAKDGPGPASEYAYPPASLLLSY